MHKILFGLMLVTLVLPASAEARYRGEVSVWVPWFQDEEGVKSALENIADIDVLQPFIYEIDEDGEIALLVDLEEDYWEELLDEADDERVEVIPTIAWFDGEAIHDILSDRRTRRAHVRDIVRLVERHDYDGIDIDYEQKKAETIDYFSDFLKELEAELGRKDLVCTIEARTPPASRWREVPEKIEYANDYRALDRYCDRVQIMAYDQQRADWRINSERRGVPYMPVADVDWVEKVLELALEDIDEDKLMLGVPTYGRAWDVTVAPEWYKEYELVATLNQPRILELSEKYNAPVGRSEGGEAVISYFPEDSVWSIFDQLPTPEGTPQGFEAAAKALLVANVTGREIPVRFVTWSDHEGIKDKIDLAEKYDLEGISIFKVDGEEDPGVWRLF